MAQVKISGLTAATAALTDLIEMESSGGMSGKITLQQVSDLFTVSRAGELYIGVHSTAPASVLLFDGSTKSRASYPDLWEMIAAGRLPSVTDAAWLAGAVGAFSTGDSPTTFRLPDWRGLFLRGMGTNSILAMANLTKFTGGTLAEIILDAMQGHGHNIRDDNAKLMLAVDSGSGPDSGSYYNFSDVARAPMTSFKAMEFMSDGTNGTPRRAGETRPASVSLNFGIYFE